MKLQWNSFIHQWVPETAFKPNSGWSTCLRCQQEDTSGQRGHRCTLCLNANSDSCVGRDSEIEERAKKQSWKNTRRRWNCGCWRGRFVPLNLTDEHSILNNEISPKKGKKETWAAGSTDVTTTHDDGVGQNCSRANGADVTGWGWRWGRVSSGLNPIIDASHCVPRQQCISNRALFKSSGLISGKTVHSDLALTGHTVPVKSDRVCVSVCGVCMRVCVCV